MSEYSESRTTYRSTTREAAIRQAAGLNERNTPNLCESLVRGVAEMIAMCHQAAAEKAKELKELHSNLDMEQTSTFYEMNSGSSMPEAQLPIMQTVSALLIESKSSLESLRALPLMHDAVKAEAAHAYESMVSTIDQAIATKPSKPLAENLDRQQIENAGRELRKAIQKAEHRLLAAESKDLSRNVAETLYGMGYKVEKSRREQRLESVIRARDSRGRAFWVHIDPVVGRVGIDMSGFNGVDCIEERKRFDQALANRGIVLSVITRNRHGRKEGGRLVNELSRHQGNINRQSAKLNRMMQNIRMKEK